MTNTNQDRLKVKRIQFVLGGHRMYGYTANEVDPITGNYINYLSGLQMAESVGDSDKVTRPKGMSQELKALLGDDLFSRPGLYILDSGSEIKLNLYTTKQASIYYAQSCYKGNKKAREVIISLATTTLDIIINDQFGRTYQAGDAQKMTNARIFQMRWWIQNNYLDHTYFLTTEELRKEGFTGDLEIAYMKNEAYLKTKTDEFAKIMYSKKPKTYKVQNMPGLANSIRTGLANRNEYEQQLGIDTKRTNEKYHQDLLAHALKYKMI